MYNGYSVEIILPAFNEENSIKKFLNDLNNLNVFDKITVINNNSTDSTKLEIEKTSAIYLEENEQGFGAALKKGLKNISCDVIVISEPDGSFSAQCIMDLLMYIDHYDVIFTSRTGNDMRLYLKFGNILYGMFISILFGNWKKTFKKKRSGVEDSCILTDVGSSLRVMKKDAITDIIQNLNFKGPEMQVDLTISILKKKLKFTEKRIKYYKRTGRASYYTGNFYNSFKVFLSFTKVVLLKIFRIV
jgi:glycosyltransferase involved in cell wall biosynthesis